MVERMNARDLDGYMEGYAEDVQLHGYPPGVEGKEGARAFYAGLLAALPDLDLRLDDAIERDGMLALRYSLSGTHDGELMGVPATGNHVDVTGMTFMRFEGGRIAERWNQLDGVTLLTQLGAIPAPA